ncbi:MAG: 30S ribosomal protein S5 [Candidatus Pacebacteria bacterium]|nr:30S ribosomal protein S5 [Candidatus Paceibacterota bacterium]
MRSREPKEFDEKVIQVNRVSKKTKGGNQMGFSILVVVGDKKGRVGVGLGKAKDVLSAIQKAVKKAKRRLLTVPMQGTTIPFAVNVKLGAAHIVLKPAPAGSGIIAGGPVRAVVDAAGIRDISSKIMGTSNQASNVYATLEALKKLRALVDCKGIKLKSIMETEKEEKEKMREQSAKQVEKGVEKKEEQTAVKKEIAKKDPTKTKKVGKKTE